MKNKNLIYFLFMNFFSEKYSVSTIIITVLSVIIILVLGFLFYYYATRPIPIAQVQSTPIVNTNSNPNTKIVPTDVITFVPPAPLPKLQKTGNCFAGSVAQPFRTDAFRCMVVNSIYDPCFTIAKKGFVYCQIGIDQSTGFLIKLTKVLPKPEVPAVAQDNWAWFVQLEDGTQCSPLTGTRPFFGNNQVAYYDCKSNNANEQIYLMGDLTKGNTWKANEAIVSQKGSAFTIDSVKTVNINTVWQ